MSNFRVGQKVVCVDGSHRMVKSSSGAYRSTAVWDLRMPAQGEVYTIKAFARDNGVYLNEIGNSDKAHAVCGDEVGYAIDRFRPLVTPEQDMALFHALCPGIPVVPPAILKPRVRVE